MNEVLEFEDVIKQSFTQYAGAVIQSRALVDVRDCVKPSARQVYYSLFTDKFTADKPFKKTLKAIGSAMRFYIHGDASCEGIIMRSGQPFAMRYPLIEIEGSYGTLTETGNWAASRYTSSRLSQISNYLLQDTNKATIDEWIDNYDDTEQYPRVLSSLGFYNIVNGSTGIAVGLASSIPQFNLTEVNNALIALLKDDKISDDEILCYPDFATGATIINKAEVAASLKAGKGSACVLQATIEYDKKEHALVVTELPYGVYTNTICGEVAKLVEDNSALGIIGINDLTGEDVCIKIYLDRGIDQDFIKQFLYANTSLQKSYSINMTMLEDGRFPKVFGWRQALLAHLNHEKIVYINLYKEELKNLKHRLKIVEAIIKAINNINEVINIIKGSASTKEANINLQKLLEIDEEQAKAILDMKLSRLAKLEIDKFIEERDQLLARIAIVEAILGSDDLLKQEMIKKFQEVSSKFGDARRTKIEQKQIARNATAEKQKEIAQDVVVCLTKNGYFRNIPKTQYKNLTDNLFAIPITTLSMFYAFSDAGKVYRLTGKDIPMCGPRDKGAAAGSILQLGDNEKIIFICDLDNIKNKYIMFITKKGKAKKTAIQDYTGVTRNLKGAPAIKFKEGDSLLTYLLLDEEDVMLTSNTHYICFSSDEITTQGKVASGLQAMNLKENEYIVKAEVLLPNAAKKIVRQHRNGVGIKI